MDNCGDDKYNQGEKTCVCCSEEDKLKSLQLPESGNQEKMEGAIRSSLMLLNIAHEYLGRSEIASFETFQQTCKNVCQARKFNRLRGGGYCDENIFFLLIRYIN